MSARLVKLLIPVLVALAAITGCVTTRVSGQKMAMVDQRMSRLGVCLQRVDFSSGKSDSSGSASAAFIGRITTDQMYSGLASRLPVVFARNGVESAVVICSTDGTSVPRELESFAEILRITPSRATWSTQSLPSMTVGAEAFHRSNGVMIWRGTIRLGMAGGASVDDAVAEELANKLLIELYRADLINAPAAALGTAQTSASRLTPTPTPTPAPISVSKSPPNAKPSANGHRRQVPPPTDFAAASDADAVPLKEQGKDRYRYYLTLPSPKAFVIYEGGGWRFYFNDADAMTKVLDRCVQDAKPCWLYAVDDRVVWSADVSKRIGRSDQLKD